MNKGALFMNHNVLGGAEKSAIEQLSFLSNNSMDVFVPKASKDAVSIENEFDLASVDKVFTFKFPSAFNKLSRSGGNNYLFGALSYLFSVLKLIFLPLNEYRFLWLNGLKVFVFILPVLCLKGYRGKVFFHLRDYLHFNIFIAFCIFIAKLFNVKLEFIANSISVKEHFVSEFNVENEKVHVCYNICKMEPRQRNIKDKFNIGLCSMFTPWKGIHTIIIFSKLYEKELRELGVEQISIFGGSIYSTTGMHNDYQIQINNLCKKLETSLIDFKGRKPAKEIYASIDMLIHSSINPEPFGRIIMEGFGANIPVLSTNLGGSSEILEGLTECCFEKYDYQGLFNKIKCILDDKNEYSNLITKQRKRYEEMNKLAESKVSEIFEGWG
jgi:glycosyltransferase involved in cell wall biosynthesis